MADELSTAQIALLCDIGELKVHKLTADKSGGLDRLLSEGHVEPAESGARLPYTLTLKAHEFLGMRGATLNEADRLGGA